MDIKLPRHDQYITFRNATIRFEHRIVQNDTLFVQQEVSYIDPALKRSKDVHKDVLKQKAGTDSGRVNLRNRCFNSSKSAIKFKTAVIMVQVSPRTGENPVTRPGVYVILNTPEQRSAGAPRLEESRLCTRSRPLTLSRAGLIVFRGCSSGTNHLEICIDNKIPLAIIHFKLTYE